MRLLSIENLTTTFKLPVGDVQAVRGISLHVNAGEAIGIVGESGSGKSVSMLSVMRLLPDNAAVTADDIEFDGQSINDAPISMLRSLEGDQIGMVFQDPMTSLNPLFTVGFQLMEPLRIHRRMSKHDARERALEILRQVDMPDPESRMRQYPHELSGGMRQRVMIGIAIACGPKLIIADEPTTALDVTIQAQILDLLRTLQTNHDTATILITHDLGVIAGMCSRVLVMYGGKIVEEGTVREIFYDARHPYTWGLLRSIPQRGRDRAKLVPIPGSPPDLIAPPKGCPFLPRCEHAMNICNTQMPPHKMITHTHMASCYLMDPAAPFVRWDRAKGVTRDDRADERLTD